MFSTDNSLVTIIFSGSDPDRHPKSNRLVLESKKIIKIRS